MRGRDRGFTLVEMLASLVILSMLSLMVVAGVSGGRRVWEQLDARTTSGEALEGVQSLLRSRIERIYPVTRYDSAAPYADVEGHRASLVFEAPPNDAGGPAALRRYRLELSPQGELVLFSQSDLAVDQKAWDRRVLVKGVSDLDMSYFGSAAPGAAPGWNAAWVDMPTPPQLVRIRLTYRNPAGREWPTLLVRPLATVDSSCVLYAPTGKCKGRQ